MMLKKMYSTMIDPESDGYTPETDPDKRYCITVSKCPAGDLNNGIDYGLLFEGFDGSDRSDVYALSVMFCDIAVYLYERGWPLEALVDDVIQCVKVVRDEEVKERRAEEDERHAEEVEEQRAEEDKLWESTKAAFLQRAVKSESP
jgi:hypothetical protein